MQVQLGLFLFDFSGAVQKVGGVWLRIDVIFAWFVGECYVSVKLGYLIRIVVGFVQIVVLCC